MASPCIYMRTTRPPVAETRRARTAVSHLYLIVIKPSIKLIPSSDLA